VDEEVEGNLEGERDWTISWIKDLGCWPRFNNGGSRAERLDSIALDGVAIYETCSDTKRTEGGHTSNTLKWTMHDLQSRSCSLILL
jgi:hypothetical protein